MAGRYGYSDSVAMPFMIVESISASEEAGMSTIELVDMTTGKFLYVPEVVWREMVEDWAEHYAAMKAQGKAEA